MTIKMNEQNPPFGCEKRNKSTADSCYIMVTIIPASDIKITLNGYNKFIIKLINKQKIAMSNVRKRIKSTTSVTPG